MGRCWVDGEDVQELRADEDGAAGGGQLRGATAAFLFDGWQVVLLPGWALTEPHFPDGFRYYGHRGTEAYGKMKAGGWPG